MSLLRSDDPVRRLRAVWLGPKGKRLPMDWTYVSWAMFLGLALVLMPVTALALLFVSSDGFLAGLGGVGFGGVGAVYAMKRLMAVVDHDRPVRYWRQVATAEWHRLRYARGPVDHVGVAMTVGLTLVVALGARLALHGHPWLSLAVGVLVGRPVGRAVRARTEDPSLAWARRVAHLDRQPSTAAASYVVRLHVPAISESRLLKGGDRHES